MGKVEAVFGGPLARGSPGYGALKRGGGERGGNENIKRGVEWACLWHVPMFRFPGVEREDDVFSSCLARAVCILREGWKGEGGGGGGWL